MVRRMIRSHTRRTPRGRFIRVKAHPKSVKLKGKTFLLSRAPWTRNPSGYIRQTDRSVRVPKTGEVFKGRKRVAHREITKRHFYGAGR